MMKTFFFYSLLMCFMTLPVQAEQVSTFEKVVYKTFKGATSWEKEVFALTPEQMIQIEEEANLTFGQAHAPAVHIYQVHRNRELLGYLLEDTIFGKWGPIRYTVGLDPQGTIVRTSILEFYEIRGRAASKNRFLKQYKGKTIKNPIRLRRDVDGVTGATITSRSLTDGVRKLVHIFALWKGHQ